MNPCNTRAIADHRDACGEEEAIREAIETVRSIDEDLIREGARILGPMLADYYEQAEQTHVGGDEAIEWAMDAMEQERKRRHAARWAKKEPSNG